MEEDPTLFPCATAVMSQDWLLQGLGESRSGYQTAVSADGLPLSAPARPKGVATPKRPAPKRHTVAGLAAQQEALTDPQVQSLVDAQQPVTPGNQGGPRATPFQKILANRLGAPPPSRLQRQALFEGEEPLQQGAFDGELPAGPEQSGVDPTLAQAMLLQSKALTTLVGQIAAGSSDPLSDLQAGSTLTTKGTQGRLKLQTELAAGGGGFFRSVYSVSTRRMDASGSSLSPAEASSRGFTLARYLEREVWRVQPPKGVGYGAMAAGHSGRPPGIGQSRACQGRVSPFDGHDRADVAQRRPCRPGVHSLSAAGPSVLNIPGPPGPAYDKPEAFCKPGRPEMDFNGPGIRKGAGHSVLEKAGVHQSEAGASSLVSGGLLACLRPSKGGRDPKAAESEAVGGTKSSRRSCPALSSSQLVSSARLFDSSDCLDLSGEGEPLSPRSCRPSSERKVASSPELCNLDSRGVRRKAAFPPGSFARRSSFWAWASSLPRLVLASKTSFARFLATTFATCRSDSVASPTALFPLPVPAPGVFAVSVPDCDPSEVPVLSAQELLIERALHVTCMALNFLHANYRPPPLDSLRRHPSQAHLDTFGRLRAMLRACSRCTDDFSLCTGRRGIHLIARLAELTLLLKKAGLSSYPYPGSERSGDFVTHCVGGPTASHPTGTLTLLVSELLAKAAGMHLVSSAQNC